MTSIRPVHQSELEEIAHINVDNWQMTYENILPHAYLESLEYGTFQKNWEQFLAQPSQQAKEAQKTVTIAILKNNENARSLYTKLGAVHYKDFSDKFGDVTTESELLIWK